MDEDEFRKQFNQKSVFKRASTLDLSFVPDKLYCRDETLKSLIYNFRRILEEETHPSINCLMLGKGGVGKTVTAKYFGRNFKNIALEKDLEVFLEYFNCIHFRSFSRGLPVSVTHNSGNQQRMGRSHNIAVRKVPTASWSRILLQVAIHRNIPEAGQTNHHIRHLQTGSHDQRQHQRNS